MPNSSLVSPPKRIAVADERQRHSQDMRALYALAARVQRDSMLILNEMYENDAELRRRLKLQQRNAVHILLGQNGR